MLQLLFQEWSPSLSLLIVVLLLFGFYNYVVHPTLVSPLGKLPNAHFTAPVSTLWLKYKQKNGKTGLRDILKAHKKYGPIVRISPNELSVCSLDGLRQAYAGGFEKTTYFEQFANYGIPNLVSMVHSRPHSIQKRMMSHVFSKSYVLNSPDLLALSRIILHDRVYPVLEEAARTGSDFDAYRLNLALGADFMNAYLFGTANATDFIRDVASSNVAMEALKAKLKGVPLNNTGSKNFDDHVLSMCEAAEGVSPPPYQITTTLPSTPALVYRQLLPKLSKELSQSGGSPRLVAASEMMDQIIAAIETSKVALTYAQWELSRRPHLMEALRAELSTLSPQLNYDPSSRLPPPLPDPRAIDELPTLNAILKEVLRLYAPSPGMFPRITPPEGAMIDGFHIPGGVSVSASSYCLHRNEEVYPDAESFKPERWLADNTKGVDGIAGTKTEQNKWFWAFGSGPRMCIGSHFAVYGKYRFYKISACCVVVEVIVACSFECVANKSDSLKIMHCFHLLQLYDKCSG